MLYTWIYIHLQAQRPLPRYTGRVHELRRGGQDRRRDGQGVAILLGAGKDGRSRAGLTNVLIHSSLVSARLRVAARRAEAAARGGGGRTKGEQR